MALSRDTFASFNQTTAVANWTTFNITIGATANIAIVLVSGELTWANLQVSLGGTAMTAITGGQFDQLTNGAKTFWRANPTTGVQTVAVTNSSGTSGGSVICWTGIGADVTAQPRPFGAAATAAGASATATGTTAGSMFVTAGNLNNTGFTLQTIGTGHTILFQSATNPATSVAGFGEKGPVTPAADQTLGFQRSTGTGDTGVVVLEVKAQAAGPVFAAPVRRFQHMLVR
jgi:hypothetical protein